MALLPPNEHEHVRSLIKRSIKWYILILFLFLFLFVFFLHDTAIATWVRTIWELSSDIVVLFRKGRDNSEVWGKKIINLYDRFAIIDVWLVIIRQDRLSSGSRRMKMFFFFLFFAIIDIDEKYKRTFFAIYRLREKKKYKKQTSKEKKENNCFAVVALYEW